MHRGKILFDSKDAVVIHCEKCGFAHVNPLPTQSDLDEYYKKRFYSESKSSYFSDFERDHDWWVMNYEWSLDELTRRLGKSKKKNSDIRMLDIGSGPGLFLDVAAKRGINVLGIEPSSEAFSYSTKKYRQAVLNKTLEQLDNSVGKFDIVHSYLVLEHILDPLHFLKKSKGLLNKSGLVCVVVPNDFNPIQMMMKKMGKNEWWISPFEHLNYFTRDSIKTLFEKAGLKVVAQSVTFPIDLFLAMGRDYLDDPSIGKECHSMRKNFEFTLNKAGGTELKDQLYKAFSKLGIGRELVIIGQKE